MHDNTYGDSRQRENRSAYVVDIQRKVSRNRIKPHDKYDYPLLGVSGVCADKLG